MFITKKKRLQKIFDILLLKFNKPSLEINEKDIFLLYQRAIKIQKTSENIEYIYQCTNNLDENIIKERVI